MKYRSLVAFALILVGLVVGASAFFDRDIETVDPATGYSRVTQKVCSDYPQNARPADCVTSAQVLNADGVVNHPIRLVVGLLLIGLGVVALIRQPHAASATGPEWKCSHDGEWNPVSTGMCQRCGGGRLGSDPVRGNQPGDIWPNAPYES